MTADWTLTDGVWSAPVGDGSITVELYVDEVDALPPLVAARAENERLWTRIDDLCTEVNAVYAAVDDLLGEVEDGDRHPSSIAEALRGILAMVDGPEATR